MTIYAYVRISSLKQEEGFGKDVQRNAILAFAKSNAELLGGGLITWIEETYSGESLLDRKVFAKLRADVVSGDHIIVFKLDRLSRTMIDTELILGEMFDRGVRVHSTQSVEQGWLDPERFKDPQNKLMRQIMAAFNEYDKCLLLGRMSSGLKAKAAKGGYAGGMPPFGYRVENDELVIDSAKVPAVRCVLGLNAEGRNPREISEHMQKHFADVLVYKSTKTMAWDEQTIRRILSRRLLYLQGRYRDRNSEVDHQRDDLIMRES